MLRYLGSSGTSLLALPHRPIPEVLADINPKPRLTADDSWRKELVEGAPPEK